MNIFFLDYDPRICAQSHVDKHVVKMILEYAQLLSTAHRVLDGQQLPSKRYVLPDTRESKLYSATHINHPSAVWVRQSDSNYMFLWELLREVCAEYTHRYSKIHKVQREGLLADLHHIPRSIHRGVFTPPTPCMPDTYKVPGNEIQSYKNYYLADKVKLFSWKQRDRPEWIK